MNEFLEKLNPAGLEEIQSDIVYRMIRRKSFDDAKVLGRWLVCSMATEFIENAGEYNEGKLSEEEIKQDCGRKSNTDL